MLLGLLAVIGLSVVSGQAQTKEMGKVRESSDVIYDYGRETHCNDGKCWTTLYSGVRFVPQGNKWIKVEDAKSLRKYDVFKVKHLNDDKVHGIDVVDFNYSCITVKYHSKDVLKFKYNKWIPVKIDDKLVGNVKIPGILSPLSDTTFCFEDSSLAHNFSFGESSTTIQLQDANTENLEDTQVREGAATINYGSGVAMGFGEDTVSKEKWSYIMFSISPVPSGATIDDSMFFAFVYDNQYDSGETVTVWVDELDNQTWSEHIITWDKRPTGSGDTIYTNDTFNGDDDDFWVYWNVTTWVSNEYANNEDNVSFILKGTMEYGAIADYVQVYTKEYTTDVSKRPFLNITYSEGTPPAGNCWHDTGTEFYIPPGCKFFLPPGSKLEVLGT